jgi:hypothetical protein
MRHGLMRERAVAAKTQLLRRPAKSSSAWV